MSTDRHYNCLSPAEAERLALVAEECAEVQQAVCKILRHGYESNNRGKLPETNREALTRELGDLMHVIGRMRTAGDVDGSAIDARSLSKAEHCAPYLHHQKITQPDGAQ